MSNKYVYITIGTICYSGNRENIDDVFTLKKHAVEDLKVNGYKYNKKEKLYINDTIYKRIEKHLIKK
mgnify:CR=1 FL=1